MNDVGRPHGYLSGPCNGAAQNYAGAYRSRERTAAGVRWSDQQYPGERLPGESQARALPTGWGQPSLIPRYDSMTRRPAYFSRGTEATKDDFAIGCQTEDRQL